MKTISNKVTEIMDGSQTPNVPFSFGDLLKIVINNPSQQGFSIQEIRDRLKIWGIIDTAKEGDIVMEDADFDILKKRFDEFKWAQIHKDIVSLADHLDSLTK